MPLVSRGRQANPVLTYKTALRRFLRCTARWRMLMENVFINGDGNSKMEATAEGRLYNNSPRLACLPGVRAERINLPPKSGCINHGKYFSKLSQPAIGSGVPPAREMGRMRRIQARIRFAPRTGLRKSAVAPRRCRCGDDSRHFYNRSSAVVACSTGVTG